MLSIATILPKSTVERDMSSCPLATYGQQAVKLSDKLKLKQRLTFFINWNKQFKQFSLKLNSAKDNLWITKKQFMVYFTNLFNEHVYIGVSQISFAASVTIKLIVETFLIVC